MHCFWRVLLSSLLLLLPLPGAAQTTDPAALVNRLTLIAAAPGGPTGLAPVYDLQALPAASFEVLINNEVGNSAAGDYLLDRARLLAATYNVLVFPAADYRPIYRGRPVRPLAVIGPDPSGSFRLDKAPLEQGQEYAWLVTAQIETGREMLVLWSTPLYFKLSPDPARLPSQLGSADRQALAALMLLTTQQQRAQAGAATSLAGLALYYNFAAASDTFFCAPLDERAPSPWPDPAPGGWPLQALFGLGDLAAELLALQRQIETAQPLDVSRLQRLGERTKLLAAGLHGLLGEAQSAQALDGMLQLGDRMSRANPESAPALLSELLIALDSVAGGGTRRSPESGLASFPAYARASVRRLEAIEEYGSLLQASMPPGDWSAWSETLRQLRAELALMADDVERGRLSLDQLRQQLARAGQIAPPVYGEEWRYVERESGTVPQERAARIDPEETEQRRRLTRELYWFQLSRFVKLLLPGAGPNGA